MTFRDRVCTTVIALVALTATAFAPLSSSAQQTDAAGNGAALLLERLRENRLTLALEDGRLSGGGAELLLSEGRNAQFFLLGEEHGVAEIPALTSAIFRALTADGYRHLAIETGDGLAAALDSLARQPDPLEALTSWYEMHWPGAPFFTLREEAALLVDAVDASPASRVLWGLDYDILADRHALPRLRALATTPAQREAADDAIAVADSLLRRAMDEGNPTHVMMFGGPELVIEELRRAYAPEENTEADDIISLLEQTRRINGLWLSREALRSNEERARWNKRQFAKYWHEASERGADPPRVMMKFGANHMMRGLTPTNVYDLGSMASELADGLGSRSFHVMVVAGEGAHHAVLNPAVMEYMPVPAGFQGNDWARPFFAAADSLAWTVYDLRPLRPLAAQDQLGVLPEQIEKLIWAVDAFVVLTGSTPGTMLPVERSW